MVLLIIVLPNAVLERHPWINQGLIMTCIGGLIIILLNLIFSGIWSFIKPKETKEHPSLLDNNMDWSKQELSEAEIKHELEKLYPIIFKDKLPTYFSFLYNNDGLATTLFYEYANQHKYIISFWEEAIAEGNYSVIYDYVTKQLDIKLPGFESTIAERRHNGGYDIILKQVIIIEEYLNQHTEYALFIHNEEFHYHLFVVEKKYKEQLLSMKYPKFWNISKLKTP